MLLTELILMLQKSQELQFCFKRIFPDSCFDNYIIRKINENKIFKL